MNRETPFLVEKIESMTAEEAFSSYPLPEDELGADYWEENQMRSTLHALLIDTYAYTPNTNPMHALEEAYQTIRRLPLTEEDYQQLEEEVTRQLSWFNQGKPGLAALLIESHPEEVAKKTWENTPF